MWNESTSHENGNEVPTLVNIHAVGMSTLSFLHQLRLLRPRSIKSMDRLQEASLSTAPRAKPGADSPPTYPEVL